jgi:hypothetical protein
LNEKFLLSIILVQILFGTIYGDYSASVCDINIPSPPRLVLSIGDFGIDEVSGAATETGAAVERGFGEGVGAGEAVQRADDDDLDLGLLNRLVRGLINFISSLITSITNAIAVVGGFATFPIRFVVYLTQVFFALSFPSSCTGIPAWLFGTIMIPLSFITFIMLWPIISEVGLKIIEVIINAIPFT